MAVGYTSTSANLGSTFTTLLKSFPEVKKVFFDEYGKYPELHKEIFVVNDSKKKAEIEGTIAGRGQWSSKNEAAEFTFGDYGQGTEITYTHVTFADAFDISEEMVEDNQWKGILKQAREMARGGYAAVEDNSVDVYNNAFTSGTGADGGYLCASSHNLINSGSTGDNADTAVLSADGLNTLFGLADAIVNESNIIIPTNFTTLLVPPALRKTAQELVLSHKTPGDSNNAANIYAPGSGSLNEINEIIVHPYLSSSTAWFLIDKSSQARPQFYWRIRPQFIDDRDVYSGNFLCKARERFSYGFTNWQGVIGSTGV